MKIYEVWRNTPMGDVTMGRYTTKEEAVKHQTSWNGQSRHHWDKAYVHEVTVLEKFEESSLQ